MLTLVDEFPDKMLEIFKARIKDSSSKLMIDFLGAGQTTHSKRLLYYLYVIFLTFFLLMGNFS